MREGKHGMHTPIWQMNDLKLGGVGNLDVILKSIPTPPCDKIQATRNVRARMKSHREEKSSVEAVVIIDDTGTEVARATVFDIM
jgi:hypothetical protein